MTDDDGGGGSAWRVGIAAIEVHQATVVENLTVYGLAATAT